MNATIDFLAKWAPNGPWVLTAISLDRKKIDTQTFRELEAATKWVRKYNGKRNLYFHVNSVTRDLTTKANREQIASVDWLHIDVDPRAGEDLKAEQKRALHRVTDNLPKGVPAPTCVIFSGGGYQAFWKLAEPIPVGGDLDKAEDAKRWNQQLELLFEADNCHNIDRIMRLPGTWNLPDAKKQKKGRTKVEAELVSWEPDRVYKLEEHFTPAPAVQMSGEQEEGLSGGRPKVKIKGEVERIQNIDELDEWNVPERVKIIVTQGKHPDEEKPGDNSRSAWLFDACCNLVRHKVPDEVIFSLITDEGWRISESVLEVKGNSEKYALRQIERAHEHAIDPKLEKMNRRYAVIGNIGGKCRVVEETFDNMHKRPRLTRQTFEDFRNFHMNKLVEAGRDSQGNPQFKPLGKWWLEHPNRREYRSIVFAPNQEDVNGSYNLWRGFGCPAKPGDCELFLNHVRENVCANSEELYEYLLRWMARAVQHPELPGEVAVVLRGGRGVGKSVFAKTFGSIFGRHFLPISNPSHLVGNFNNHLRDVVVLFADEAFYAGDKKHVSILKTLITEDTITIEAKGIDAEAAPNFVHLIMASNDAHVIPAGEDERRFLVLDVAAGHKQDSAYFGAMLDQMNKEGGKEALLHMLLTMDLTGWDVRRVPSTKALQEQKLLSLDPEEDWWYNKLLAGKMCDSLDEDWPEEIQKEILLDDYIAYADRFKINRRGNATLVGRFLRKVIPGLSDIQRRAMVTKHDYGEYTKQRKQRVYFWRMPDLERCRTAWDARYGKEEWPEINPATTGEDKAPEEVF